MSLTSHELAHSTPRQGRDQLTPRQQQVLWEVVKHATQADAARCLGLSYQTVKNHMAQIHTKLECQSTVQVMDELGWLRLPGGIHATTR